MGTPLAVTLGEPSGIGPDIVLAAWLGRSARTPAFAVFGDPAFLARRARLIGLDVPIRETALAEATSAFAKALPVVPTGPAVEGDPGRPSPADAEAVIGSIEAAVAAVAAGEASAIVTPPIHKKSLAAAGFGFPGHTEFLGALATRHFGGEYLPVMMLASDELRVVPVTVHMPLRSVFGALTVELIEQTGLIVARDLIVRFGIDRPRIAVAGINPHAGEEGLLGHEDEEVVAPAVAALRETGIDATGPHSADALFTELARPGYDAALAMYHDQALIPIKTLAFDRAVNVTLGLPFVRTSPDHGTAFVLAGTGRARPQSFVEALALAARMTPAGTGAHDAAEAGHVR